MRKSRERGGVALDLTNQRFGILTVERRVSNRRTKVTWECRCDCGTQHEATTNELRRGRILSCGCLKNSENLPVSPLRLAQRRRIKHHNLLKKYHLSLSEFEAIGETQNWQCPICKTITHNLVVDHEHGSNKIRSLLCAHCNSLLGFAKDTIEILQSAITYLEMHHG